ncbi:MAG: RIP metalloprotease RseP [Lachnospiraceae bacterium]|nr:RIP metalloprotease RseP [Lachnospiraceae bacterium]
MKWVIAVLIFSLLILFHEFGHFLLAKLNGVTVEEFSLGFGPRILSAVRGETRYSIKLLLFGGSCRMKGMMAELEDDEYEDDDEEEDGDSEEEERRRLEEDAEGSFLSASLGQRAAIIFAGPFFNFLLAFICSVIVISVVGYDPALVVQVAEGSPAAQAGLQAGDTITSFNGEKVVIGRDLDTWFMFQDLKADTEISLTYKRDGNSYEISFLPETIRRYMMGLTYSLDSENAVVDAVSVNSPLDNAGIRSGDIITAVNGTEITTGQSLYDYFQANTMDGSEMSLQISRSGRTYEKTLTPVFTDYVRLGFSYNLGRITTTPAGVLRYSFTELRYWIVSTVKSLGGMFTGRFSVNDLSGPVGIVDIVGTTYEEAKEDGPVMTWMNMLNLIILLSANLGVMNLLPLPVLDGGRLLFILLEALRGKPLSQKVEASIQTVVAVLLILLMVYVMYHDLLTLIAG